VQIPAQQDKFASVDAEHHRQLLIDAVTRKVYAALQTSLKEFDIKHLDMIGIESPTESTRERTSSVDMPLNSPPRAHLLQGYGT